MAPSRCPAAEWCMWAPDSGMLDALKHDMAANGRIVEHHWDGIITPGLINAHTHLQYTNMAEVGRGTYDRFRAWELGFNEVYEKLQETRPVEGIRIRRRAHDGRSGHHRCGRYRHRPGSSGGACLTGHAWHRLLGSHGLA